MLSKVKIPATALAVTTSLFLTIACNIPLWRFFEAEHGSLFALRCLAIIAAFYCFILGLLALPRIQKPAIGLLLLISAAASYFINKYGVFIDSEMIRNATQTDNAEVRDLLGPSFFMWMTALFVTPTALLYLTQPAYPAFSAKAVIAYARLPLVSAIVLLGLVWGGMQELAPFYRNHREVRHMIVPYNAVAAAIKYTRTDILPSAPKKIHLASPSTRIPRPEGNPRQVVVLVVGETARAANFSLGGYARETNPQLQARNDIVYFDNFTSCGTHTAYSLPCMFSSLGRKDFKLDQFNQHDDLLSLIANAGINTLWIDNNSGCKGVCNGTEIIREADLAASYPQYCQSGECHDGVLVEALQKALKRKGDLFIVLHQKGSHGPLYHKRVPAEFARFQPACDKADLAKCTQEKIVNAYDNTILYTDHVLNGVIEALKGEELASMLYASDHGESLGEKGMYLHGAPYMLAPSEQTHIPAILWMSKGSITDDTTDPDCMKIQSSLPHSHDNIFATLLDLNQVKATTQQPENSLLNKCQRKQLTRFDDAAYPMRQ